MPITTGPGTISVMIALGTSHPTSGQLLDRIVSIVASVAASVVLAIIIYLCFAFADRVSSVLGNSATQVLMRLTAFILFCIRIRLCGRSGGVAAGGGAGIISAGPRTLRGNMSAVVHPQPSRPQDHLRHAFGICENAAMTATGCTSTNSVDELAGTGHG